MNNMARQHVLVLGLGASGLALARWCARQGAQVQVVDTRAEPPGLAQLRADVPDAVFTPSALSADLLNLAAFGWVLRSPGLLPVSVQALKDEALARGIVCGNELTTFAQALADLRTQTGYAPATIAITGTNGKTTVTALTSLLVASAGKTVAMAGNIGPTLLDTLMASLDAAQVCVDEVDETQVADDLAALPAGYPAAPEALVPPETQREGQIDHPAAQPVPSLSAFARHLPQVWVLELSSFQLEGVRNFEPTVATVLNLSQDHLDWHGDMPSYAAAKINVYGPTGLMLLNRDDPLVMAQAPQESAAPVVPAARSAVKRKATRSYQTFGMHAPQRPGDYGIETVNGMAWLVRALQADETIKRRKDEEVTLHIQRLMPLDALRIRGRHNATNALAALGLAVATGCTLSPMLYALREYKGEPHRVESVGVIEGVEYFDDSKGTNVGATVAALQGLGAERQLVLVLGGEGKGQDFSPLAEPVTRHVRSVVLIGADAPLIRQALQSTGVPLLDAASMEDAVALASQAAHAGDAVLMSPACASFDMFENYGHRARVFCDAVHALAHTRGQLL